MITENDEHTVYFYLSGDEKNKLFDLLPSLNFYVIREFGNPYFYHISCKRLEFINVIGYLSHAKTEKIIDFLTLSQNNIKMASVEQAEEEERRKKEAEEEERRKIADKKESELKGIISFFYNRNN